MDGTNKAISFVLGLVVVIVFLAVVTGRLKLGKINFLPLSKGPTPTVTGTPNPTGVGTAQNPTPSSQTHSYQTQNTQTVQIPQTKTQTGTYQSTGNVKSIPNTGAPTVMLPIFISMLGSGLYLRKKK